VLGAAAIVVGVILIVCGKRMAKNDAKYLKIQGE
jgi:hypothetical protein